MANILFAGIFSLPVELLDEIIDYVALSAPKLLTLRCVNKALCGLITPVAFRDIVVRTTETSTQGFLELLDSTDIAKHVRIIEVIGDRDSYEDDEETFERVRDRLSEAFALLHLLPSLESLVITFLPEDDARPSRFRYREVTRDQLLQFDVFEGLAGSPNPLPALQSLDINAWFALIYGLYYEDPFKLIVASLRDLRFTVQDIDYNRGEAFATGHDFWTYVIGPYVLQPAVNLTSLAMESSVLCGSLIRLDLGSITLPCLTSLSLSNFAWDDTRLDPQEVALQAEDFIVRHGKTLKKLELQNCTISIPYNRSTPVRSWTAVWNRFADELTELVDLNVGYFGLLYVQYLPEYGFSKPITPAKPGTEQDIPVLDALAAMVRRRKELIACDGG